MLPTIWFILIFVLLGGYAVLDGFDLGVGVLHLFARDDHERRISINSIAPVWDGNEVWLLTGGGALFAAFPPVYATVFSGFYIALMLLLAALMARAVAMEFRGKVESATWRRVWDWAFGLGSLLPAVLFGVAFGNILRGIALTPAGDYAGTFFDLLNPFAVMVGVLALVLFTFHGAVYLTNKTEGEHQERMRKVALASWFGFIILYVACTIVAALSNPTLFSEARSRPLFWVFAIIVFAAALFTPIQIAARHFTRAIIASSAMILSMMGLSAIGLYPRLVPALGDPAASLTIYNSSSTPHTLMVMLIIALIGMPIVIAYTFVIYRAFKGKVVLDGDSY